MVLTDLGPTADSMLTPADSMLNTRRQICLARCLLATYAPRGPERTDALHGLNAALELLARAEAAALFAADDERAAD